MEPCCEICHVDLGAYIYVGICSDCVEAFVIRGFKPVGYEMTEKKKDFFFGRFVEQT